MRFPKLRPVRSAKAVRRLAGANSRLSWSELSYNSRRLPKALHYQFTLRARAAITPDHLHLSTRSIVGRTPSTWTTRHAHRRTHARLERQAQALGRLQRLPLSQGQVRPRASSAAGLCRLHQLRCFIDRMPPHRQSTQETHGEAHEDAPGAMEADQLPAPQPVEASAIAMSPGLSSLLEAADNTAQPSASASTFPDSTTSSDVPIIQNGLFTAFGSSTQDIFQVASLQHRQSTSSSSTESISPANPAFTPKSIQDLSESSSPEAILSHAAFLSSRIVQGSNPRPTKRKNPFDRPSLESSVSNQVGFVGGLLGIASLDKHLLDVCTKAYFESMGQCIGFIRPEWYWPRYHSYFSRFAGLSDPAPPLPTTNSRCPSCCSSPSPVADQAQVGWPTGSSCRPTCTTTTVASSRIANASYETDSMR